MSITRGRWGPADESVGRMLAEGVRVRGLQFACCGLCKCVAKANVDNCEMHSSWRFSARSGTSSACRGSRQGVNDKNYSDSVLRQSKRRSTMGLFKWVVGCETDVG